MTRFANKIYLVYFTGPSRKSNSLIYVTAKTITERRRRRDSTMDEWGKRMKWRTEGDSTPNVCCMLAWHLSSTKGEFLPTMASVKIFPHSSIAGIGGVVVEACQAGACLRWQSINPSCFPQEVQASTDVEECSTKDIIAIEALICFFSCVCEMIPIWFGMQSIFRRKRHLKLQIFRWKRNSHTAGR